MVKLDGCVVIAQIDVVLHLARTQEWVIAAAVEFQQDVASLYVPVCNVQVVQVGQAL